MDAERMTRQTPDIYSQAEKTRRSEVWKKKWEKKLGVEIGPIKPFPKEITPKIEENLNKLGFDIIYIPSINFGTHKELKENGVNKHLDEIIKRYPSFQKAEAKNIDPDKPTLIENGYWQEVLEEKSYFPEPLNGWVAVESNLTGGIIKQDGLLTKLGLESRVNNSWNEVKDAISSRETGILSRIGFNVINEKLTLLSIIDRNLASNIMGIDNGSRGMEFTNTTHIDRNDRDGGTTVYVSGYGGNDGAGFATRINPDKKSPITGFRTAIILERP